MAGPRAVRRAVLSSGSVRHRRPPRQLALGETAADALDGLLERGQARGVGKPQIALAEPPEARPGKGCDARLLEQDVLQRARIETGATHVGKRIKGAAGIDAAEAWQTAERGHDVLPALGERLDHLSRRLLRSRERGDAGVLGRRIDAGVAV